MKTLWLDANLTSADPYDIARKHVQDLDAFATYEREYTSVQKVWEEFIKESEDVCTHHHSRSRKSKKNKKHKKRTRSSSKSVSIIFFMFLFSFFHENKISRRRKKNITLRLRRRSTRKRSTQDPGLHRAVRIVL